MILFILSKNKILFLIKKKLINFLFINHIILKNLKIYNFFLYQILY